MNTVYILLFFFAYANSSEVKVLETFVKSIVDKWQLLSPTLIVPDEIPEMCLTLDWGLCLSTDMSIDELTQQLATIHKPRQHDGVVFVGAHGHEDLIKKLAYRMPSLFTSNNPIFMSTEYTKYISLRLDSNVIFYVNELPGIYKLVDKFAVKGGTPIVIPLGYWNIEEGVILKESMNRWDRRTDLKGANFYSCMFFPSLLSYFIKDESGNIIATKGYYQDVLFYVTENLNLSVVTVEGTNCIPIINCTCFDPRTEVDVHSYGVGIHMDFAMSLIDLPLIIFRSPVTLIAAKQKGTAPNMWVYVQVFGIPQWILFIVLLTLLGMALVIKNGLSEDEIARNSDKKISADQNYNLYANFGQVYIYAIQMGNHPNSKHLTSRILTLTASILTFIMFAYYTNDITSKMTAGPPSIPVKTFEDVIHYGYKVIPYMLYYEKMLRDAKPGTAKNIVYNSYLRTIDTTNKTQRELAVYIFKEAISDSKTLIYMPSAVLAETDYAPFKELADQMVALKMDDAQFSTGTVGLQKDSEFLQIFNHYFLQGMERGFLRRLYRFNNFEELFNKESFEMMEPQPLGFNNVMFCFIILGLGVCLSTVLASTELIKSKLWRQQLLTRRNRTNESGTQFNRQILT